MSTLLRRGPSRQQERGRRRPRAAVLLAVAAVLNAGAGIALGIAVTGNDDPPPAPPPREPEIVAAGDLRVALPQAWRPLERPPEVPGVTNAAATAARGPDADLIFAELQPENARLLPQALVDAAGAALPEAVPATIGGREALRYAGLAGGRADVYAVPTSAGVATLACMSRSEAALAGGCDGPLGAVDVGDAAAIPADERAAFAIRLPAVVEGLNRARAEGRRALARQRNARGRARVARRLAGAYRRTAGRLAPLAGEAAATTRIIRLLGQLRTDHRALAAASARRAPRAARRAGTRIRRAERRLAGALGEWTGPSAAK